MTGFFMMILGAVLEQPEIIYEFNTPLRMELMGMMYLLSCVCFIIPIVLNVQTLIRIQPRILMIIMSVVNNSAIFFINSVFSTSSFIYSFLYLFLLLSIWLAYNKNMKISNNLQNSREEDSTAYKMSEAGIMQAFNRPNKLTEEEDSISKERKVCLVCKNRIIRNVFVCPECESFYCNKCFKALVNLENACWSCNHALDESKSVKLEHKPEDKLDIEVSGGKVPKKFSEP